MSYRDNLTQRLSRVAPQIRPAGASSADCCEPSVGDLISSYHPDACTTPPHIKAFQHRGSELGQPARHWKAADDMAAPSSAHFRAAVPTQTALSRANGTSEMNACLHPGLFTSKETAVVDGQREQRYASNVRRPLGHAPSPAYPIPTPAKGFGISEHDSDSTQQLMRVWKDAEPLHVPGEQMDRHYDWASKGIDPAQHRFGMVDRNTEACTMTRVLAPPAETQITRKVVMDYKSTIKTDVGQQRSYGFDDPAEWPRNATHQQASANSPMCEQNAGKARHSGGLTTTVRQDSSKGVREVLTSWAEPHPSASASSRVASRTCHDGGADHPHPAGAGRVSGAPSQTHGSQTSAHVSHVDQRGRPIRALDNLGDDITAGQLLQPCLYVQKGIDCKYFAGGRDLEEVRALCYRCDFDLSDDQIDEVFAENARGGRCGIELFKNAARRKGYL